jgi:hypothetical protein
MTMSDSHAVASAPPTFRHTVPLWQKRLPRATTAMCVAFLQFVQHNFFILFNARSG